ncbi:MAG: hypothetical protein KDA85_21050 [Planctomycetaceae bacterium]|nr:hypothetical protein [Planctomycetaceae bacterium]
MSGDSAESGEQRSQQQQALLLDLTQFVLDLIGIVEPTPFADGTNTAISLGRRDWLGAGLSAISLLPYLGDIVKLGKIPRYERTLSKALALAVKDAQFAEQIRPVLTRLKRLLDDAPISELPAGLRQMRDRISRFLQTGPKIPGPVSRVLQKLPGSAKSGFLQAMKLPPLRNPRRLRNRPGPVSEDSLLTELARKGFVRIKQGSHSPKKRSARGGAVEDSDIYIRRIIGEDEKQYFEAIRVDRKFGGGTSRPFGTIHDGLIPSSGASGGGRSAADVQRSDKQFRRIHNTLGSTSSKAGVAQGGRQTLSNEEFRRMVNDLQAGSKKGEFSHWHHERIPADPETLGKYLTGPVRGTQKFDNVGQLVVTW